MLFGNILYFRQKQISTKSAQDPQHNIMSSEKKFNEFFTHDTRFSTIPGIIMYCWRILPMFFTYFWHILPISLHIFAAYYPLIEKSCSTILSYISFVNYWVQVPFSTNHDESRIISNIPFKRDVSFGRTFFKLFYSSTYFLRNQYSLRT